MSCDILVLAPHPDDAEIQIGATIARQTRLGARVVVVDATQGEMGSRGDAHTRAAEAAAASTILGLAGRDNLALPDGFVRDDLDTRAALIACIRRHQPRLILGIHPETAHPDHQAIARCLLAARKAAALHRMPPTDLPAWQEARLLCYEGELPIRPDLLLACDEIDWQTKRDAICCYGSQLHRPGSDEPPTSIARADFLSWVESRGRTWGHHAGAPYAEAFSCPFAAAALGDLRALWPASHT